MMAKYMKIAEETGVLYANSLYASFTKYSDRRGKNFTWAKLPDMCGRIAAASLFTCFSDDEWYSLTDIQIGEIENISREAAIERVKELLNKEPLTV